MKTMRKTFLKIVEEKRSIEGKIGKEKYRK